MAKSLPNAIDTEIAIVGAFLTSPSILPECIDIVRPEYFYLESHAVIVETVLELFSENIPVDLVNVYERLRLREKNMAVGDLEGLKKFLDFGGNPDNVQHWLGQVKSYWELRAILEKCDDIGKRGLKVAEANIDTFLQEVESVFMQLADKRTIGGLRPSSEVVKETILALEALQNREDGLTGIPTGFRDLDEMLSGFQRSDLIVLAARPAMGKTALALNFATNAAIQAKKHVAFFSLEMSRHQLMQRMLSSASRVHSHKFRKGDLNAEDYMRLLPEAELFNTDRLAIDDTASLSLSDLRSRCRKFKRDKGCDLIIIDYLQLMTAGAGFNAKSGSRELEVSHISRGLKGLAKELNCPVIALSQLNRSLEQRPDKRPKSSDLRESGAIEQDADQIMFIYRDEVYHKDSQEKGIAEVIVGKNRHGAIDTVKLAFLAEFTQFFDLARQG
jgi:replicative DNA helicase